LIAIIEGGGTEYAPLDDSEIEKLLVKGFHNCTKMGAQATALGGRSRRDPFLNLASTLQGMFTETIIVRHRPSHRKFLDRINSTISSFVEYNLAVSRRSSLEVDLQAKLVQMIDSVPDGP
jgi:hypothetical protein